MTTVALLQRPVLAVSAAIFRDGRVLLVRRARPPAQGVFTLPGGKVEAGETLHTAILREVSEETALRIALLDMAGYREVIMREPTGEVTRHFVIIAFAALWQSGEPALNDELDQAVWVEPGEIDGLTTTDGLGPIVAAAAARVTASSS